jgi:hypothetical protein
LIEFIVRRADLHALALGQGLEDPETDSALRCRHHKLESIGLPAATLAMSDTKSGKVANSASFQSWLSPEPSPQDKGKSDPRRAKVQFFWEHGDRQSRANIVTADPVASRADIEDICQPIYPS